VPDPGPGERCQRVDVGCRTDENCFTTQLSAPAAFQHDPGVEPMVSKSCNSDGMTPLTERPRKLESAVHVRRFPSGSTLFFLEEGASSVKTSLAAFRFIVR